jgi:proliferating cell nuclear antigen PCNA
LYEVKNAFKLAFDSNIFFSIISTKSEDLNMLIEYDLEKNPDTIHIQFVQLVSNHLVSKDQVKTKSKPSKVKGEFNKYFKMPLMEYDYQELEIHNIEYDAEFSLSSKQISEMCSQLNNFGDDIIIHCSQDDIDLISNGTLGEMRVNMSIDDLNSYSIVEDMNIKLTYSLTYINKMCITPKISNDVQFSLNENTPMKILYNLGDDSIMSFFIAPKVNDEN